MKSLYLLLGIALFLLIYRLDSLSYLESSEARYAEISREMLVSGDYVTPTLIDIKHFHKPPLTYWMTAISFKLFGINNFSGRIFPTLCGLGILIFTFLISRMLFPGMPHIHLWSVGILLSSLLFLVQARVVTTDIYLSFLTIGAIYFQWKRKFYYGSEKLIIPAAILLALAFLTKGLIPFIFFIFPYFVFIFLFPKMKNVNLSGSFKFLIIFIIIVTPWFWLIIRDNPKLLEYFMVNQTVDRYASTVHHRSGSPFYYIGVLLVGMLSWFMFYFPSLFMTLKRWKTRHEHPWEYLLIAYTFIPLVFFSFSGSKLPAYIMPALPFFSILLAYWIFGKYQNHGFKSIHILNFLLCLLIPLLLIIRPFKNVPSQIGHYDLLFWFLLCFPLVYLIIFRYSLKNIRIRFEWVYGIYNITLFLVLLTVLPSIQDDLNSFEGLAKVINSNLKEGEQLVSYKVRLPSLYFYTGQRVIHLMHDREIQFEDQKSMATLETYLSNDPEKLADYLLSDAGYYVTIRRKDWLKYLMNQEELATAVDTLYENQKYLLLKNQRLKM
ncbi:MAG: glycosyltransferase family 39 protein [Candidatus Marinimicrobia bacterium]|nr:glycosyltransferase family 39 protein [Candidatus Neomarinimicrobiota bacterium]